MYPIHFNLVGLIRPSELEEFNDSRQIDDAPSCSQYPTHRSRQLWRHNTPY
jgi:hypothetical protein